MADFISDYRENGDLHPDVSKIIISACIWLKSKMNGDYTLVRDLVILNGTVH